MSSSAMALVAERRQWRNTVVVVVVTTGTAAIVVDGQILKSTRTKEVFSFSSSFSSRRPMLTPSSR
jgi:hypothetical protein